MSVDETSHNIADLEAEQGPVEPPEHGLPGHMVKVIIIGLVLVCMLLSGFGNIATWTNGVEGVDYAIAFGTGIISEVIGAVLLVVIIWCMARPSFQRLLMAILFLPVWSMATFQNASASWSYYVEASNSDEIAAAQKRALETRQALKTQANLAQERIEEIKSELSFIGMTRTPEEIRAERDRLPDNYVTKRAELTAELNKAERRISLDTELSDQRAMLSKTAGAGVVANVTDAGVSESQTNLGAPASDMPASAADIHDIWSFLGFVQTNRLGSLVLVMEIMKSFGLLLVNVVFAGEGRKRRPKADQTAQRSNTKRAPAQNRVAQTPVAVAPTAKVIPMLAVPATAAVATPAPAPRQEAVPKRSTNQSAKSNIRFADEEDSQKSDTQEESVKTGTEGGIGISSKFV
ncbi:hypothetical protein [Hirschia litorea]|uniref:Uncharacterized protein n=1 Tax=Hirschia litorea TaxID=1199156 RepID=A0ABW2IP78_9PROT